MRDLLGVGGHRAVAAYREAEAAGVNAGALAAARAVAAHAEEITHAA
jgi:hypothetical protein